MVFLWDLGTGRASPWQGLALLGSCSSVGGEGSAGTAPSCSRATSLGVGGLGAARSLWLQGRQMVQCVPRPRQRLLSPCFLLSRVPVNMETISSWCGTHEGWIRLGWGEAVLVRQCGNGAASLGLITQQLLWGGTRGVLEPGLMGRRGKRPGNAGNALWKACVAPGALGSLSCPVGL